MQYDFDDFKTFVGYMFATYTGSQAYLGYFYVCILRAVFKTIWGNISTLAKQDCHDHTDKI